MVVVCAGQLAVGVSSEPSWSMALLYFAAVPAGTACLCPGARGECELIAGIPNRWLPAPKHSEHSDSKRLCTP